MINLMADLPPPIDETRAFFAMLTLVTDPKAAAQQFVKLNEAAEKAGEACAAAKSAQEQLARDRATHDEYVRTSRAEHDAKMDSERATHEHACRLATDEIRQTKSETDRLNAKAQVDAQAAAELKADLESRLLKIKLAAG